MTINIVCINNGPAYGIEYVNKLADMVLRNLNTKHNLKFFCATDNPEGMDDFIQHIKVPENLTAWWAKLYLFKDGLFPDGERVVYIDTTSVITSGLDEIIQYDGEFAILRDFLYPERWQPAFMIWKAGTMGYVWDKYVEDGYPCTDSDDMKWINQVVSNAVILQDIFPDCFVSYKVHCKHGVPKGAKVVKFHGFPKMGDFRGGYAVKDGYPLLDRHAPWVENIWKIGGGSSLELEIVGNTGFDKVVENIKYSLSENIHTLDKAMPEHDQHIVIVGGGPSINKYVDEIRYRESVGQDIAALNNTWLWLHKRNFRTDYHVMVDARPENVEFVPWADYPVLRLYATQCDRRVIDKAKGDHSLLWNSFIPEVADAFSERDMFWVGSGTSVGIRSIFVFYTLGYRNFHLYGYDSSYENKEGHAYEQKLNEGEKVLDVVIHGKSFRAAPWMISQAQEFLEVMEFLTAKGCTFTIHGEGLLPYMASTCLEASVPSIKGEVNGIS